MDFGPSDEERARLAELSRRRSARLLLVVLAIFAAVGLVSQLFSMFLGRTDDPESPPTQPLADLAVSLAPLTVVALIGLALYVRNRARPLLLLGAEPDIQRQAMQAMPDGHAPDPYVDALETDLAVRQAKQRWLPIVTGALALVGLVLTVIGAESTTLLLAAVGLYVGAFLRSSAGSGGATYRGRVAIWPIGQPEPPDRRPRIATDAAFALLHARKRPVSEYRTSGVSWMEAVQRMANGGFGSSAEAAAPNV